MPKFLVKATYTTAGLKGLRAEGGTRRAEVVQALVDNSGGRIEALYFAMDGFDVYAMCELPDFVTASGLALAMRASGGLDMQVTTLMTAEEVDRAVQVPVTYQPPGG